MKKVINVLVIANSVFIVGVLAGGAGLYFYVNRPRPSFLIWVNSLQAEAIKEALLRLKEEELIRQKEDGNRRDKGSDNKDLDNT